MFHLILSSYCIFFLRGSKNFLHEILPMSRKWWRSNYRKLEAISKIQLEKGAVKSVNPTINNWIDNFYSLN